MTAYATLENYSIISSKEAQENSGIIAKNITNSIKNEFISSYIHQASDIAADVAKIIAQTAMSLKQYSQVHYKTTPYLEPSEVDQIKTALNNYANNNEALKSFKKELLEDLTNFQEQIKVNQAQRLQDLRNQKANCEKQLMILNVEKSKLIMDRLSKIVWPYDQKTSAYSKKIAALETQLEQLAQKITDLKKMRPAANEKDILLYQLHLKEKYTK